MDIQIRAISDSLSGHAEQIVEFLGRTDSEKRYFNLTLERVLKAETILVAYADDALVGIGGIEVKYRLPRDFIMVDRRVQGKGLGRQFLDRILDDAARMHSILMAVIEEPNAASLKLHRTVGFRMGGKRGQLNYLFFPIDARGLVLYYIVRLIFPGIQLLDRFRR